MRVLHVIESLGGGVLSSVLTMVDATPDIEHHLAIWPRRTHADTGDARGVFGSVHRLPSHPVRAARELNGHVRDVGADVVHAHSSYAGVLARTGDRGVDVVYSPHCFAFERRDLSTLARTGFREVERSLVRRTAVLVACSPHEASLAVDLGHRRVVVVPNRALHPPAIRARPDEVLRILAVGRIGPQKDWRHLLAVKQEIDDRSRRPVHWEWLGSGDTEGEEALRGGGVAVSGWLPREDVVRRLGAAQAYVHSAAWEAAPVSILEAAAVGIPIVARAIPTLVSLDVPGLAGSVDAMATRLLDLHDPGRWASEQRRSLAFAAEHSASVQRYRLNTAYQHVPVEQHLPQARVAVEAGSSI